MVLSKLCATTDRRVAPALPASSTGVLPLDAIYEILLRLPAKDLCRLRTVCRPWRSLLSDPQFIDAHSARHTEPLIAYMYNGEHNVVMDIMDLSGKSIKKVHIEGDICLVRSMVLDLVCFTKTGYRVSGILNVATGAVYDLPENLAEEHVARGLKKRHYIDHTYAIGQVASMGDYKVVRVLYNCFEPSGKDLFEICTLSSGSCWRAMQAPSTSIITNDWSRKVIDGVIYFLSMDACFGIQNNINVRQEWLVPFDLQSEKWRPSIRGPNNFVFSPDPQKMHNDITLANLNGSLVIVHWTNTFFDLWFLMDIDKSLWIKQYSLRVEQYDHYLKPLSVLHDGRILMFVDMDSLVIHDPRTNTTTNVLNLKHCMEVRMYTGNLLSLDGQN